MTKIGFETNALKLKHIFLLIRDVRLKHLEQKVVFDQHLFPDGNVSKCFPQQQDCLALRLRSFIFVRKIKGADCNLDPVQQSNLGKC